MNLKLWLVCLLVLGCPSAFAGSGSYCSPDDKNFQAEVKSELCLSSQDIDYQIPKIKWVSVRGYDKNYPSCKDFGYEDFDQYERNFWGELKCNAACQTFIDFLYVQNLKKMCGKDYKWKQGLD